VASHRFKQLAAREAALRSQFVVAPRLTPSYSKGELDSLRAYRLLLHAEIESYIEDRARWAATRAIERYKKGRVTLALVGLLAFEDREGMQLPKLIDTNVSHLLTRCHKALNRFEVIVGRNHGLKEENLIKIVVALGISESDLDPLWVTEMSGFGADRGAVAHSAVKTQQPPDPQIETNRTASLLLGLADLDALFARTVR